MLQGASPKAREEGPDSAGHGAGQRPGAAQFWLGSNGKWHRKHTAEAARLVRVKRRGKSSPHDRRRSWQAKPHPEQHQIGTRGAPHVGASEGGPPQRAGRWLERLSNESPRGMIVTSGNRRTESGLSVRVSLARAPHSAPAPYRLGAAGKRPLRHFGAPQHLTPVVQARPAARSAHNPLAEHPPRA